MANSPPKKQPRLDEATLTTPASVGSGASQTQSVRVDEIEQKAAWVDSPTLPFPTGLPMEHEYLGQDFYVRSCYSKYYKYVMRWLDRPSTAVVTVTGTPGIGKSIFCAYFLKRLSFEDKEATIITESYSRKSVLKKAAAWKGGKMLGSAVDESTDSSAMKAVIDKAKTERQATHRLIYLIDGPPRIHPGDAQSVVFASPNDAWFSYIRKDWTRPMVVMPLWTMKELEAAAIELDLTMQVDDPPFDEESMGALEDVPVARIADLVEQRFHIFGGVARECLSVKEKFVKKQQDIIEAIITMFKDPKDLRAILKHQKEHEKMYHRICYFVPNEKDPMEYTIAEPTPFVRRFLTECLGDLTKSKRKEITDLLDNPAAASFRGALFENIVHDQLNSGCRFKARALEKEDSEKKMQTFECAESTPQEAGKAWCYFDDNFSASVLSSGPYHVPTSKRFASIDSFYYEKTPHVSGQASLCLFQMTVAKTHPVNGAGLVNVLTRLGLLRDVRENPKRVALIFSVPLKVEQEFTRQTFVLDGILGDADSVRKVHNIGAVAENALKADPIKVHTIGELRTYLEGNQSNKDRVAKGLTFGKLRRSLSEHDEEQKKLNQGKEGEASLKDVLEAIPQFVWGVGT